MSSNAGVSVSEAPHRPNNWFCTPHLSQQEDQLLAPLNPTSHLVPYSLLITIQWRKYYSSCSLCVNVCVNYGWKCEIFTHLLTVPIPTASFNPTKIWESTFMNGLSLKVIQTKQLYLTLISVSWLVSPFTFMEIYLIWYWQIILII